MNSSAKRLLIIFASLVVIAIIVLIGLPILNNWLYNNQLKINEQKLASGDETGHVMLAKDDMHIFAIEHQVAKSGRVTNADLDWLLNLLAANQGSGVKQEAARSNIVQPLLILKVIPSTQEEKIYQATLPMFGLTDTQDNDPDIINATRVMRVLRDSRAIPYLLPLLSNPFNQVRLHAQSALDAVGYKPQ